MNDMSFDDDKDLFKKSLAKQTGFKAKEIQDNDIKEVGKAVQATPEVMKSGVDPQGLTPSQINEAQGDAPKKMSAEDEDRQQKMYQVLLATLPTLVGAALGGTAGAASGAEASHATLGRERALGERQKDQSLAEAKEQRLYAQQEKLRQEQFLQQSRIAQMSDDRARELQKERLAAEKQIAGMRIDAKGDAAGKPIAGDQAKSLEEIASSGAALDDLKKMIQDNPESFGPVVGQMKYVPYANKAKSLDAQIGIIAQNIGKSLEGGKLTDQDIIRYRSMLPQLTDPPELAVQKLDNVQRMLSQRQAATYDTLLRAGYNVRGFEPKAMPGPKAAPMIQGGGNAAIAGPAPAPDFDSMSEAELKKYLGGQ